jgi:hypothetical protein
MVRSGWLATGLLVTVGCGSGLPATFAVKGKVVWKGGKPVEDGRIEFQSLSHADLKAVGEIEQDGSFTLTTHKDGRTRQGAVAGEHRVLVEPDVGDDERPLLIVLPKPHVVEPRANDIQIVIEKPRRK